MGIFVDSSGEPTLSSTLIADALPNKIEVETFTETTQPIKKQPNKARIAANRSYGSGDDGKTVVSNDLTMEKDSVFCEVTGLSDTVSHYLGVCYHAFNRAKQSLLRTTSDVNNYEAKMQFYNAVIDGCTRLQTEMNVIAALVYTYAEDERYEADMPLLDTFDIQVDDWSKEVGDGPSFTQWGDGGSLELHLNAIRVHVRTLERAYVSWMRHGALRKNAVYRVKRHLAIINRSSLWAYWAARKAGNYYRADGGHEERFWEDVRAD